MDHLMPQYLIDQDAQQPDPARVQRLLAAVLAPEFNTDAIYQRVVLDEIRALTTVTTTGEHSQAGG